jgi:Zn finger protein HypA/HybF involved in hydrogenase expression
MTTFSTCSHCGSTVTRTRRQWICPVCHSRFCHAGGLAPSLAQIAELKAELRWMRAQGLALLTDQTR